MNRRRTRRNSGFTLIEMAIAIAIIAVLAITVLLGARFLITDSRVAKTQEAADTVVKAYMLAMVSETATSVTGITIPAGNCARGGAAGVGGNVSRWELYYPSETCTSVDGTNYGIAGVAFAGNGVALRINCNDTVGGGTACGTIYTRLAGSYRPLTTLGSITPCATAAPAAGTTAFTFCASL